MLSRVADSVYWLSRYVERDWSISQIVEDGYDEGFQVGTALPFP